MRIRAYVTSAALAAALLSTSSLATRALAEKGQVSTPVSSWAISKVDDSGGAYCTMARKYSQSTVMTFARNIDEETSFALDFQRSVLKTGTKVNIVLDAGAGQQREYNVQPFSDKALVVRLGRDNAFFSALDRTGLLRVEIEGESYPFSLSDIGDGQEKLSGCVAEMVAPAAGEEQEENSVAGLTPAPVEKSPLASESAGLDLNALQDQIKSLKKENARLGHSLSQMGESDQSFVVDELSRKVTSLTRENEETRKKLDLARLSASDASIKRVRPESLVPRESSPESDDLLKENLRLKAEIQTLQPHEEFLAELESQLRTLKQKNSLLEEQLKTAEIKSSNLSGLDASLEELRQKNEALEQELARQDLSQQEEFAAKIRQLETENSELKSNLSKKGVDAELFGQLRQQIALVENENRLLKESAAKVKAAIEDQRTTELLELKTGSEQRIAELENSVKLLQEENEQKSKDLLEMGESSSELQMLKEENATLKERTALLQNVQKSSENLSLKIAQLEEENAALRQSLQTAQMGDPLVEDTVSALRAENESLKLRLANVKAQDEEIRALQLVLQDAEDQAKELDQIALKSEESHKNQFKALEERIALQAEHSAKLKQALENLIPVAEGFKNRVREQEAQIAFLENDLQQSDEDNEKLALQAAAKTGNEEQILSLKSELDKLKMAKEEAEKLAQSYLLERNDLKPQAEGSNALIASSEEQENKKLQDVSKEIVSLTQRATQAEELAATRLQEIKFLTTQVESYAQDGVSNAEVAQKDLEKIASLEGELKTMAVQNRELKNDLDRAISLARESEQKIAALEARKEQKSSAIASSEDAVKPKQKTVHSSQKIADESPQKVQKEIVKLIEPASKSNVEAVSQAIALSEAETLAAMEPASGEEGSAEEISEPQGEPESQIPLPPPSDSLASPDAEVLNEAQLQEEAVKKRLVAPVQAPAAAQLQEAVSAVNALPAQSLAVRKTEDPFADIIVENSGDSSTEPHQVQALASPPPLEKQMLSPPVSKSSEELVAVPEVGSVASDLSALLAQAQIPATGMEQVPADKAEGNVAYQWRSGAVFGTAEQRPMRAGQSFDEMVKDYLQRTEQRCPGDFAVSLDNTSGADENRTDTYEIACVGKDVSSGASLIFYNKNGTFTVVAHEAPAEQLDQAMNDRNQIRKVLTGT